MNEGPSPKKKNAKFVLKGRKCSNVVQSGFLLCTWCFALLCLLKPFFKLFPCKSSQRKIFDDYKSMIHCEDSKFYRA